ncbi:DNA integrity scanning protein DisA [subsurface metagenome]
MVRPNEDEESLLDFLRLMSPGTPLGQALEIILQAGTGGLIVVGDTPKVLEVIEGGFKVDCRLTPTALAELAKMDGAIVLSRDRERILYANTQLVPDYLIPTTERGTRHRAAERMAKQTGCPVIAISQTRSIVSLYRREAKYVLKTVPELLRRASQALQTLERYQTAFNEILAELDTLEFQDKVRLSEVLKPVERGELIRRIKEEVDRYIIELGLEARLIEMQLKEIVGDTLLELRQIVRDYAKEDYEKALSELATLRMEEILELTNVMQVLGYQARSENLDLSVFARGYRALCRIPHLPQVVVENVVKSLGDLPSIISATAVELMEIDEVGEIRANSIRRELERLKDGALLSKPR